MSAKETKTYSYDPKGYYTALGVSYNADEAVIKQSYRDRAKILHPDHNTNKNALEDFQKLSVAYDVIKDEELRLIYDLLAQAYPRENFPDMTALKVYKNQKDEEDVFIRTFNLRQVVGKIVKYSYSENNEICNYKEAQAAVLQTSLINWTLGWWNVKAAVLNVKAIIKNIKSINANRQENFTLLVHNAIAYYQDGKKEQAHLSALQAGEYANSYQKGLLNKFITLLKSSINQKIPDWNYNLLKLLQMIIPGIIVLSVLGSLTTKVITDSDLNKRFSKTNEIAYYQQVRFRTGGQTVDDVIVAKIIDIPVDPQDTNMLYHTNRSVKVMHGPSDNFDVMTKLNARKTVRMTGYSPDKVWYRVMVDDGTMGFVRSEYLNRGIGQKIPDDSKVFTGKYPK